MNAEIQQTARELCAATTRGDLAEAYAIAKALPYRDLAAVALESGFSCISERDRREFHIHLQAQLAEACRRRTDGYGLRAHNH